MELSCLDRRLPQGEIVAPAGAARLCINLGGDVVAAIVQDLIPQARERQQAVQCTQPQAETHNSNRQEKGPGGE